MSINNCTTTRAYVDLITSQHPIENTTSTSTPASSSPQASSSPRAENPRRQRPQPLHWSSLAQNALLPDRRRRVRRPAQPSPKAGSSTKRNRLVAPHPQLLPQSSSSFPQPALLTRPVRPQMAFSEIERLSQSVKSAGNPISPDLKAHYIVKGPKKEQTTSSVVNIYTNSAARSRRLRTSRAATCRTRPLPTWSITRRRGCSRGGARRGKRVCGGCVEPNIRKRADSDFDKRFGG